MKTVVHEAIRERLPWLSTKSSDSFVTDFSVCLKVFGMTLYDDWIELEHLNQGQKLGFPENHIFQEPITVDGGENLSLVCMFCQGDIWNRHLSCDCDAHPPSQPYVLCMECFGRGRGCPRRDRKIPKIYQCFPMASPIRLFVKSARKLRELEPSAPIRPRDAQ